VNPEEGAVRLVMFAAMAAFLVVALCVPGAFGDEGLLFAAAYALVRFAQIGLFLIASRDDPGLRHAVWGLLASTALGTGLLVGASFADGLLQGALWAAALGFDMAGPLVIDPGGWRLEPGHFAERHGLIVIIALGESIVAIGVGAAGLELGAGELAAAALGVVLAAALWWVYFDEALERVERRLHEMPAGRPRNVVARDSFSYLHLPLVAGIVLLALGVKKTLEHVDDPIPGIAAVALCGGVALYLAADVAFRRRCRVTHQLQRLVAAGACLALLPLALELPALAALAAVAAVAVALAAFESARAIS
jgi:low temperature requirement protein LtrA